MFTTQWARTAIPGRLLQVPLGQQQLVDPLTPTMLVAVPSLGGRPPLAKWMHPVLTRD
ncbi:hypothetical protein [Pseudomonas sp. GL-B-19]|uniref:hypothetical protein n=1 Tax=Pseudomonas sp. GL-B-19 TaxID=2832393 RepID=UPI001CBE078B|nr:hypothetical protein [Pseudomonas sp. GL-B-19]